MRTVYFICVNYNNSHYTDLFLKSVFSLQKPYCKIEVIVIDNASAETEITTLKRICDQYPGVKLIQSATNVGYFRGLNVGLEQISPSKEDYVVVGNNDLTFEENFVGTLFANVYSEDVLVLAPNVITADGYHQNPHCAERVSNGRKLLYTLYFQSFWLSRVMLYASRIIATVKGGRINRLAGKSRFIHMGIGACYVLTPGFFKHYSKLDESVFLYGEEALLAGQVMAVNGKTYYDADLIVNHAESATLSKLPSLKTYSFAKDSYPRYAKYL